MSYKSALNKYLKENFNCIDYINAKENKFNESQDFNNDYNVNNLADWFKSLYFISLKNSRLFAKQSDWSEIVFDYYELSAFKSCFKNNFKTIKQFKKTKDILSDSFTFKVPDFCGKLHTFYFCVNKKELAKRGSDYLEELKVFFDVEIEKRREKLKGKIEEEV